MNFGLGIRQSAGLARKPTLPKELTQQVWKKVQFFNAVVGTGTKSSL